jgi:hypothetical protein
VEPETVEWLWEGRIAIGKLTLLVGDPGLGKSFLTLDIAARVSRGAPWPDQPNELQGAADVVLLSAEDDVADTIRPRLDNHEADCKRIVVITGVDGNDERGGYVRQFDLVRDIDQLRAAIDATDYCRLVIIDPITAYLGKTDSHVNAEVRSALAPLAALAAERRVAILGVSHLRKGEGMAIHRTMGSLAFVAAARAAWAVVRDKQNPRQRLLLPVKNNIAPDGGNGLAFTIESHGPADAPVVCWSADPVTIDVNEAMAAEPKRLGRPAEDREEAGEWLRDALSDGPRPAKEVTEEAIQGEGLSKRTLDRARKAIGVESYRESIPGPWWWKLPVAQQCHNPPPVQTLWHSGNLANSSGFFDETDAKNPTLPECHKGRAEPEENGKADAKIPLGSNSREYIEL